MVLQWLGAFGKISFSPAGCGGIVVGGICPAAFGLWGWDGRLSDRIMDFVCDPLFLLRLLSSLFRNAVTVMLWTLMGAGLVETIYGFGQLYGWFASGHSLYRLTGSFLTRGLIRDF